MLTSIDVKFIFNCLFIGKFRSKRVLQDCKHSSNSRCRPSSCLLAVLTTFLASSSLFLPRETSEMFRDFVLTTTTQPRPRVFSVNCLDFWQFCCTTDVIFDISQNSSKFGRQWLVMMNYAWGFSQSEPEKYFEWIIMYGIYPRQVLALFRTILQSFRFWDEDVYEYVIFSILRIALAWISIILAGKRDGRCHSTSSFCYR